jgi:hypothetical protein
MSYVQIGRQEEVDSWLLVIKSQMSVWLPAFLLPITWAVDVWIANARPFSISTFQDLSNDIKNTRMQGVLPLAIDLWTFESPGRLPTSNFSKCWASPPHLAKVGLRHPPFLNYVLCLRHNIPYLYTCILAFFIYNVICNYAWYIVKIFWIWYCIEYSAFWRHAATDVESNISGNGHATQIRLFVNSFFIKWLVCSWWRCLSTSLGSTTACKPRTSNGWLPGWLVWTWHSWWYV